MSIPVVYDVTRETWRVHEAWSPRVNGSQLHIPADYETDLASIPRILRWFINTYELGIGPPVIHDFIYGHKGQMPYGTVDPLRRFTRRDADRMFHEAMRSEGVGRLKARVAWLAVRGFGWVPWPPSKSHWRQAFTAAVHTIWQTAAALLLVDGLWVIPTAGALSVLKGLLRPSVRQATTEILYR